MRRFKDYLRTETALILFPILILTYLVFIPSLFNSFVNWDDNLFLIENPVLAATPLTNLKDVFFSHPMGTYYPLATLIFQVLYHLFHLQPQYYHLTNLVLHLLNVTLVFYLLTQFRIEWKICALTALLFGIHPLQVETVAWVASLKDLLCTFFYLLALIYYSKNAKTSLTFPQTLWLSLIYLLALSAKVTAVTLPLVLLLIDFYQKERLTPKDWLNKIPLFILALTFGGINLYVAQVDQVFPASRTGSFLTALLFSGQALVLYLSKLVFPYHLANIYPLPERLNGLYPWDVYVAAFLSLLFLPIIIIKGFRDASAWSSPNIKSREDLSGYLFESSSLCVRNASPQLLFACFLPSRLLPFIRASTSCGTIGSRIG